VARRRRRRACGRSARRDAVGVGERDDLPRGADHRGVDERAVVDAPPVETEAVRAASDEGERAVLLATDRRALFTAALPEDARVEVGRPLRLAVDPSRLHFFDPDSGARLDPDGAADPDEAA
jgi:hypothetical protein